MIKTLTHSGQLLALMVPAKFREPGIHFFTPDDLSQQLAYMCHPRGKIIAPHVHKPVIREVQFTQEVLVLIKGRLRVDFYTNEQYYLESWELQAGDVILLATGGHGFEVLEEVEMFEVKQGPYAGDEDKIRFAGINARQAKILPIERA